MNALCLHSGSNPIPFDDLATLPTPSPTRTFQPVPHADLVRMVRDSLDVGGLRIASEEHAVQKRGSNLFSIFHIDSSAGDGESRSSFMVGLRNSHVHDFAVGLCIGFRVFVCDNRAFRAERVLSRKHTPLILTDLPRRMNAAVTDFVLPQLESLPSQIQTLETSLLLPHQYAETMLLLLRKGLVTATEFPRIDREWTRTDGPGGHFPDHGPTAWRLLNAVTEVHKHSSTSPGTLAARTQRIIHALTKDPTQCQ